MRRGTYFSVMTCDSPHSEKLTISTPKIAEPVANKGGPPQYVERNWDRLVKAAHTLAELAVEQQAAAVKK